MPAGDTALRHHAFLYETEDEYLAVATDFLREGLELGQGAVVANTRVGIGAVREALGTAAADVTFVDVSEAYTRPVKTLAAYHQVYARTLSRFGSLRAVADVQLGQVPAEWDLWTGYEAVFNRSFAHLPAWVLCSYRANALPDVVRAGIWRTHPGVVAGGTWNDSAAYDDRNQPWRPDTRRPPLADPEEIVVVDEIDVLREHLVRSMHRLGVPAAKVLDLVLATTEILTNALTHGEGVSALRAGLVEGRYVCEVVDQGPGFDDALAGYLAPRAGRGSGLWVARQLTWDLELFWAPDGFTARITA
jgi:anti-sigma regulatory factor (Ser/Thr protein kinase)